MNASIVSAVLACLLVACVLVPAGLAQAQEPSVPDQGQSTPDSAPDSSTPDNSGAEEEDDIVIDDEEEIQIDDEEQVGAEAEPPRVESGAQQPNAKDAASKGAKDTAQNAGRQNSSGSTPTLPDRTQSVERDLSGRGNVPIRPQRKRTRAEPDVPEGRIQSGQRARVQPIEGEPPPWWSKLGLDSFVFTGFVQTDAVLLNEASVDEIDPSTGEPLNETRFTLTRARLAFLAQKSLFSSFMMVDGNTVNGPAFRVFRAWGAVRTPWDSRLGLDRTGHEEDHLPLARLTMGLMKIPFGREVPELARQRQIALETTTAANALFPGTHDLGARIDGAWGPLRYAFAAMNGEPSGSRSQYKLRDPNKAVDFVGRIGVDAWFGFGEMEDAFRIEAGVSALKGRGFSPGRGPTKDTLTWVDANEDGIVQQTELQVIAGSSAVASQNFDRFAVGGDVRLTAPIPVVGPFHLIAEMVFAENLDRAVQVSDPVAAGRDLRNLGWHLGFTQNFTKYALLGLRYAYYTPDLDASEAVGTTVVPADTEFDSWTLLAQFLYLPFARIGAEYEHRRNPFGLGADGLPATLAEDRFTLRMEIGF